MLTNKDIAANPGRTPGDSDGVMVLSAWTHGAAGGLLVRVTMTGRDAAPAVRVVGNRAELHAVIDEWFGAIGDDPVG
jgi:hypothetical protein